MIHNKLSRATRSFLFALIFTVSFFAVTISVSAETEIIARTGQASPSNDGSTYGSFYRRTPTYIFPNPFISESGRVCFWSKLNGVPSGYDLGVFCNREFGNQTVWRNLIQAPGTPEGVRFNSISSLQMNKHGAVSFNGLLQGPGVVTGLNANNSGLWINDAQGTRMFARLSELIPGIPFSVYNGSAFLTTQSFFTSPSINAPLLANVDIDGVEETYSPTRKSVLHGNVNSIAETLQQRQVLPGQSDPNVLVLTPEVISSRRGPALYKTTLYGSSVGTVYVNGYPITTDRALVSTLADGSLHLIGRTGITQVPDMPSGVRYTNIFQGSAINDTNANGDTVFLASVFGPGVNTANNWAIFLSENGVTRKIVRLSEFSPIPNTQYGGFATASGSFVKLTDDNAIIFTAGLFGSGANSSNNSVIFYNRNGITQTVYRIGTETPGLPAGTYFSSSSGNNFALGHVVGSMGHVALTAKLAGTGVTTANDIIVTLWDPANPQTVQVVAREGDMIDSRYRVTTITQPSQHLKVNSRGQMVFTATVNDTQTNTSQTAIIAGAPGQPTRVLAVTGSQISGTNITPTGIYLKPTTTSVFDREPDIAFNDNGEVVFTAVITVDTDEAVVLMDLDDIMDTPCMADFDGNGLVQVQDIFAFLSAWFAGSASADINGNGSVAVDDIFAFLSAWFAGC